MIRGRPATKPAPAFGSKLSKLRKKEGLSQEQLATALQTTRGNIDYYERRAHNPTMDFIQKCADFFNVPASEMMSEETILPKKRGPKSELEKRFDKIRQLPRKDQKKLIEVIDVLVNKAS